MQCTTAGPYNATPADLPRAGSACGLGINLFRFRIHSLAARFRTAANSNTLADGLAKISAAREHDGVSLFALTPEWEEQILKTSTTHSTVEACPRRMLAHRARSRAFGNFPPLLFTVHALFCAARWKIHSSSRRISNARCLRVCYSVRELGSAPTGSCSVCLFGRTHVFIPLLPCFF